MNRRWALIVVLSLAGLAAFVASVSATPARDFTAVQQWKGVFDDIDVKTDAFKPHKVKIDTKGVSDVYITRNFYAAVDASYVLPTGDVDDFDLVSIGWGLGYRF